MASHRGVWTRVLITAAVIALIVSVGLFLRPFPDEPSAWQFFRHGAARTDSAAKAAALIFFTMMMVGMSLIAALARLRIGPLLPIVLLVLAATALLSPGVRRSRLVRAGFALLALGVLPLVTAGLLGSDNPVGLGFLFAFLTPIAGLMIVTGTALALTSN